jgi:hypothetical protein
MMMEISPSKHPNRIVIYIAFFQNRKESFFTAAVRRIIRIYILFPVKAYATGSLDIFSQLS